MNDWTELGINGRAGFRVSDGAVDLSRPGLERRAIELPALPQSLIFDASRAALVIIDMQNDFCAPGGWISSLGIDVAYGQNLVGPINRATAAFRAASMPVVWLNWGVRPDKLNLSYSTRHPFNPNGSQPGLGGSFKGPQGEYRVLAEGNWGAAIIDGLEQKESDIHVSKHRISGFWDTPLDSILRTMDIRTLFFAGVNADHCVLGTQMDANFAGYDTVMLQDCVGTTSPDFCMDATLHNVRFCFGFTATSEDVASALT